MVHRYHSVIKVLTQSGSPAQLRAPALCSCPGASSSTLAVTVCSKSSVQHSITGNHFFHGLSWCQGGANSCIVCSDFCCNRRLQGSQTAKQIFAQQLHVSWTAYLGTCNSDRHCEGVRAWERLPNLCTKHVKNRSDNLWVKLSSKGSPIAGTGVSGVSLHTFPRSYHTLLLFPSLPHVFICSSTFQASICLITFYLSLAVLISPTIYSSH